MLHVHVPTAPWVQESEHTSLICIAASRQSQEQSLTIWGLQRPTKHNEIHSVSSLSGNSRTPLEPAFTTSPLNTQQGTLNLNLYVDCFIFYGITSQKPQGLFPVRVPHPSS